MSENQAPGFQSSAPSAKHQFIIRKIPGTKLSLAGNKIIKHASHYCQAKLKYLQAHITTQDLWRTGLLQCNIHLLE